MLNSWQEIEAYRGTQRRHGRHGWRHHPGCLRHSGWCRHCFGRCASGHQICVLTWYIASGVGRFISGVFRWVCWIFAWCPIDAVHRQDNTTSRSMVVYNVSNRLNLESRFYMGMAYHSGDQRLRCAGLSRRDQWAVIPSLINLSNLFGWCQVLPRRTVWSSSLSLHDVGFLWHNDVGGIYVR